MTLIELIMFIVIVSVGVAGILVVLNTAVRGSADPLIRKQMLSIAESLLEEVELQPFSFCDPTDDNVATATSPVVGAGPGFCASSVENLGPEPGESRFSLTAPFNNVNDYYQSGGYSLPSPITDISNSNPAPAGYSATIEIIPEALPDVIDPSIRIASDSTPANMRVLRIAVTVTHDGDSLLLEGYRTRHSPNFAP